MASARERNGRWIGLYRTLDGAQRSAGTFSSKPEALAAAYGAEVVVLTPPPVKRGTKPWVGVEGKLRSVAVKPACWGWSLYSYNRIRTYDRYGESRDRRLLTDWHKGRCAVCGDTTKQLVCDHSHDTGLVRGWLCNSCNTREGKSGTKFSAINAYREQNPASILGIELLYTQQTYAARVARELAS